ncbi:hypothetical protein KP509_16G037700 [Ceratopteris richardii]|uniref:AB hydrolase-1 domain-containing protein n=1 Tax=Ceratopteris richardii TaxID=49495 RepID=A0A8T2SZH2_CERRI|nr:hypothetical protein KP509_16G037700 [Ceratopteris richardii]
MMRPSSFHGVLVVPLIIGSLFYLYTYCGSNRMCSTFSSALSFNLVSNPSATNNLIWRRAAAEGRISEDKNAAIKEVSRTSPTSARETNRSDGLCASLVTPRGHYSCKEFVGGDIWVLNEPSEGLGFILADAGYDVWIGNTRTTRFSFGHSSFKRSDREFWDWSVDEMAQEDLPAMLGFVSHTVGDKFHYIGYSQGSQQAFAAFSQGQLVNLVDKVVMLAPVAYVDHGTAPVALGLFNLQVDKVLN